MHFLLDYNILGLLIDFVYINELFINENEMLK